MVALAAGAEAVVASTSEEERILLAGAGAVAAKPDSNTAQTTEVRKRLIFELVVFWRCLCLVEMRGRGEAGEGFEAVPGAFIPIRGSSTRSL